MLSCWWKQAAAIAPLAADEGYNEEEGFDSCCRAMHTSPSSSNSGMFAAPGSSLSDDTDGWLTADSPDTTGALLPNAGTKGWAVLSDREDGRSVSCSPLVCSIQGGV